MPTGLARAVVKAAAGEAASGVKKIIAGLGINVFPATGKGTVTINVDTPLVITTVEAAIVEARTSIGSPTALFTTKIRARAIAGPAVTPLATPLLLFSILKFNNNTGISSKTSSTHSSYTASSGVAHIPSATKDCIVTTFVRTTGTITISVLTPDGFQNTALVPAGTLLTFYLSAGAKITFTLSGGAALKSITVQSGIG